MPILIFKEIGFGRNGTENGAKAFSFVDSAEFPYRTTTLRNSWPSVALFPWTTPRSGDGRNGTRPSWKSGCVNGSRQRTTPGERAFRLWCKGRKRYAYGSRFPRNWGFARQKTHVNFDRRTDLTVIRFAFRKRCDRPRFACARPGTRVRG